MRALLVTVTCFALAGLLWIMGGRWLPSSVESGARVCPHAQARADAEAAKKKKPKVDLTNRVWRNKAPKDARDLTFHLVLFDKAKIRTGAMAHLSEWRMYIDRVRFGVDGNTLTIESPQDQTKTKYKVRTWPCKGEAPKPFDLCLELKRGMKKVTLYSEKNAHFGRSLEPALARALTESPAPTCEGCEAGPQAWFEAFAVDETPNP